MRSTLRFGHYNGHVKFQQLILKILNYHLKMLCIITDLWFYYGFRIMHLRIKYLTSSELHHHYVLVKFVYLLVINM